MDFPFLAMLDNLDRGHGAVLAAPAVIGPGDSARSGKLLRARSRLYRSEILQANMRLKALAEIYTMHSFAQLCNLNFCQDLPKNSLNFAKFGKISP